MKFFAQKDRQNVVISDCRFYRIETTMGNFAWFNAYFDPTRLHAPRTGLCVGANNDKEKVKVACADHAKRIQEAA